MYCNKCGRPLNYNDTFCPGCGSPVTRVQPVNNVQPTNHALTPVQNTFNKVQKIIIIGLLSIIIVFLIAIICLPSNTSKGKTRTVMMYIVGSNLESNSYIVTGELKAIDPQVVNTKENNILLYTGGTEQWHNFISSEENAIYLLKDDGFNKIESQSKTNLGSPDTLTNFMKYAYENYPADEYYLILYDHGGAIDGAIYDDFTNDNLSLHDLSTALKNSPFNEKNKLNAVIFRTCLNGTIEVANVFESYAKYLVASEEISYGQSPHSVLGFINNTNINDTAFDYSKKFVDAYKDQMDKIDMFNTVTHTYSIIDLSEIKNVNKYLNEYIAGIDIQNNYNDIVRIRAGLYQYGSEALSYNMVDLYSFVEKTSMYSKNDSNKLLAAIRNAVVYNYTNNDSSHGLSIYFPFSGGDGYKRKFLNVYSELNYADNYKTFINGFYQLQNKPSSFAFNIDKKQVNDEDSKDKLSIQLSQEQIDNYGYATFTIFELDKDHLNYYAPIFNTDDVVLDSNGVLSVDYTNKILKATDDEGDTMYCLTYYRKTNNIRFTYGILLDKNKDVFEDDYMVSSILYFTPTVGANPKVGSAKLRSYNERLDGTMLDLNNYKGYEVYTTSYRILDNKGNVLPSEDWEDAPIYIGWSADTDGDLLYEYTSLDNSDNYYGLFIFTDIYDNVSYSKLIKVDE